MNMNAQQVLDRCWDGFIPVDVMGIAQKMGIVLNPTFEELAVSGYIELKNSIPYCTYNALESETRQRFTVAHEIGHYVLGHLQDGKKFRDTSRSFELGQNVQETQANRFAAELLMPSKVVGWLIKDKNLVTVEALSEALNVSTTAMVNRLKNLGWVR
ncbi:MAG: ImmA/IrrE family metallo-endopeptidase [Formosimonas sp.]